MDSAILPPSQPLRCISSMATRQWLAALCERWTRDGGGAVELESVGGVDAANRIAAGEDFDVAVLAADALDRLAAAGHVGPLTGLAVSQVAIAAPAGLAPPVATVAELRRTLGACRAIGYSTGPSGKALLALLARWDLLDALRERLVQAPPGVPVGELLARGTVDLGFQQHSELIHCQGVALLGLMPPGAAISTLFAGALCHVGKQAPKAVALIAYLASPSCADVIRSDGMVPVDTAPVFS
ncbi:MAG: ABC transporter substrate-binding protein [Oxalobacteraceae bacterium]|nr:MAG: ABC transporter substrate-binding protein [Oxalobacteraceae bacterium]